MIGNKFTRHINVNMNRDADLFEVDFYIFLFFKYI